MISLDTETTGLDLYHGAKPYLVTIAFQDYDGVQNNFWEWEVDPFTREPLIPEEDLAEIREAVATAATAWTESDGESGGLILQNAKFDVAALAAIGLYDPRSVLPTWPWGQTKDSLILGHLLASNQPHDLTSMAIQYLGIDIQPYEERLKEAVKECRRKVQQEKLRKSRSKDYGELADWRIASDDQPDMPSATKDTWKFDTWLPRAVARYLELPEDHPYWTVTNEYANADSSVTLALWPVMKEQMERRGLTEIYKTRMSVIPVAHKMESRGVTVSKANLDATLSEYSAEVAECADSCINIADSLGYALELPKGASPNNSLRKFMFDVLKVPPIQAKKSKTSAPTLNKEAMDKYLEILPENSKGLAFLKSLTTKRKRDTAIAYMESYKRFWIPLLDLNQYSIDDDRHMWFVLHPFLNPTGTHTLRWSSNNPNEQNISKQTEKCRPCKGSGKIAGEKCGTCGGKGERSLNIRYCFGPAPGREWWSCDAKNIELRIPAYEANEEEMILLFERPDDPPYFGSNHLLISHILHTKMFEECRDQQGNLDGRIFKKKYAATWYQWVKNGNFATQYGAVDKEDGTGTADRAYHMPGAQARIKARFRKMEALNQHCIDYAEKFGYVETIPDKSVDPRHGYPLMCTRTEYNRIKPTVPLNYHVQGTAMWWMQMAMIRCQAQLDKWNAMGFDGHIAMQVHDELVFDFPKSTIHPKEDVDTNRPSGLKLVRKSNLWRVRALQKLMEQGGADIGIPTPTSSEYHEHNWREGITL